MTEWENTTLGKICEDSGGNIQTGPFGSQLHASDYVPVGVPSIMPQNIGDNRVMINGIARITDTDARRLSRYLVKVGDIVYSRRGDVERRALIRETEEGWLCGTGCLRVRFGDKKPISPTFISYYLDAPHIRMWIVQHAVGATMPNLNTAILSGVPVRLPPYHEQKAIADVLSALDDKIDLNRHMKQTLEATAQALFKSWFVDFDPVRAKAEGREPEGMDDATASLFPARFHNGIPEGWSIKSVSEAIKLNPPEKLSNGMEAPYLEMAALPTQGCIPDLPVLRVFSSGTKFRNGDTLLARITPCLENGKTAYIAYLQDDQVAWGSTEFIVMRSKPPLPAEYTYLLARDQNFRAHAIRSMTGTSGRQRVQTDALGTYEICIPTDRVAQKFGQILHPLFMKIVALSRESITLSQLRDTLLPRLISGKLRVDEISEIVEALAS